MYYCTNMVSREYGSIPDPIQVQQDKARQKKFTLAATALAAISISGFGGAFYLTIDGSGKNEHAIHTASLTHPAPSKTELQSANKAIAQFTQTLEQRAVNGEFGTDLQKAYQVVEKNNDHDNAVINANDSNENLGGVVLLVGSMFPTLGAQALFMNRKRRRY